LTARLEDGYCSIMGRTCTCQAAKLAHELEAEKTLQLHLKVPTMQ